MYFLYRGLCLVSEVVVYLYMPETKCVPLEELGALFDDNVVVHLTDGGHGIVEEDGRLLMQDDPILQAQRRSTDAKEAVVTHEKRVSV